MTRTNTREHRFHQLFEVLQQNAGKTIGLEDLAEESGYTVQTLYTYLTKNKLDPFVMLDGSRQCHIQDLTNFSLGDLKRSLSQRENRHEYEHLGVSELVSNLLVRSRTNAGLALELINRPELANRLDAFVLLFVTAWEQLLKAKLEHREKSSIFTGATSAFGRQMTINLTQTLERAIPERNDPVRRNIEWLKELRDGAAHLLVSEVTGIATRYFQSGILNYIRYYQDIANEAPFRFEGTGLLTLGVAYNSPSLDVLRVRHGQNADEIKSLITKLEEDAEKLDDDRFAVSIQYQLVLEKKAGPDAIRLVNSPHGLPVARVEVPVDPSKTHPYTATSCATLLQERTNSKWTKGDVATIAEFLDKKSSTNPYHRQHQHGQTTLHTYSEKFIDLVVERLKQDGDLLKKARAAKKKPANKQ